MKITWGGFTIIEVMIVLAISSLMLGSAAAIFSGRRESTDFSQAVYDVQSEIQSIANGVSSQSVPGLQQYVCSPVAVNGTMRPVLAPGSATGQNCVYLGQAIQFIPSNPTIYSYPIFGLRTVYNGSNDTGDTPTTVAEAHPEPAISSSDPTDPNNLLLINTYNMINGLQTSSATFSGSENDILTFYTNLQNNNTSGNEIAVSSMNYSGSDTDPKAQMKDCIEGSGCPATGNQANNTPWKLCLSDTRRQAELTIKATATGIVTNLDMGGCS